MSADDANFHTALATLKSMIPGELLVIPEPDWNGQDVRNAELFAEGYNAARNATLMLMQSWLINATGLGPVVEELFAAMQEDF